MLFLLQDKVFTDTLVKTMVEPRRRFYSLPAIELRKKVVGGIMHVTVISASKLHRSLLKGNSSRRHHFSANGSFGEHHGANDLQTFVEVELGGLSRKTDVRSGSSPTWNSKFNMVLHESAGTVRFHLYEFNPSSVKYDYLASCEVKVISLLVLVFIPNYIATI